MSAVKASETEKTITSATSLHLFNWKRSWLITSKPFDRLVLTKNKDLAPAEAAVSWQEWSRDTWASSITLEWGE